MPATCIPVIAYFKPSDYCHLPIYTCITGTRSGFFSTSLRTTLSSVRDLVEQSLSHTDITYASVTYASALPIYLQSGIILKPLPLPTSCPYEVPQPQYLVSHSSGSFSPVASLLPILRPRRVGPPGIRMPKVSIPLVHAN